MPHPVHLVRHGQSQWNVRRLQLTPESDSRLREQHLGDLEGRTYEETWAAAETFDWSDPTQPIGGGESLMDGYDRMSGPPSRISKA